MGPFLDIGIVVGFTTSVPGNCKKKKESYRRKCRTQAFQSIRRVF